MMKIAVMQPYFFPYIGYYQLVYSVDEFVAFDDVNFFKKGYINRNVILANGKRQGFTIPVANASQNRKIADHYYLGEFGRFLSQVAAAYRKAPFFKAVRPLIEAVAQCDNLSVAQKNVQSIQAVFNYLGLNPTLSFASQLQVPDEVRAQDRIIEICRRKGAAIYHNAVGGQALYQREVFAAHHITLKFVEPHDVRYFQTALSFEPSLSIIDVLMWNPKHEIAEMLGAFSLV